LPVTRTEEGAVFEIEEVVMTAEPTVRRELAGSLANRKEALESGPDVALGDEVAVSAAP
jgi:hypothetical protein